MSGFEIACTAFALDTLGFGLVAFTLLALLTFLTDPTKLLITQTLTLCTAELLCYMHMAACVLMIFYYVAQSCLYRMYDPVKFSSGSRSETPVAPSAEYLCMKYNANNLILILKPNNNNPIPNRCQ